MLADHGSPQERGGSPTGTRAALAARARVACLLLAPPLLAGCGAVLELPPPDSSPLVSPATPEPAAYSARLATLLAIAEVESETRRLDFADLPDTSSLGRGWALEPSLGQAWGTATGSSLTFNVMPVRDLVIEIRCAPFHFEGSPTQRLTVTVNDAELETLRLWDFMWEYEVRVPAEVLRFGANRLDLGYAYSAIPAEVLPASKDGRSLAVLFERFSFGGEAPEVVEPAASADGSRLDLPFSSRVSYFLELGAESRLRIGGVELWPEASGPDSLDWRLRLEAVADGEERTTVVELGPRELSQPIEMELPTRQTGQRVRIALAAFSNRPRDAVPAGLTLDLPEAISRDEALAALLAAREQEPVTPPAPVRGPNILVYMIDTLRADHVGAYGYDRATSPNLDSLAADGTLFRSVVAQSSWTKPSVASVLTGLNPQIHGVNGRGDALAPEAVTLAELLWEAGYDTAAIFTNGNLAHMGLGQGYAHYQHLREGTRRSVHVLSDALNDEAFRWLDQRDGSRPFFLYLHATDPHSPYTPPDGFLERLGLTVSDPDAGLLESVNELQRGVVDERQLADLVALYDAEIAFNDEQFGRLVAFLERRGLYDSTLIIVVSDHGEEFFDHGWWQHGKTLYEEQLAVPLIVRFPGGEGVGETVDAIAQHIDIAPTVLDLAGIEAPAELPGRSLRALLGGSAPAGPVNAISYLRVDRREAESVRSAIGKLILHHYDIGGGRLLFDLESDPAERRNLYESRPVLAGYLEASLRAFHLAHDTRYAPEKGEIDAELAARLRDLGYVN